MTLQDIFDQLQAGELAQLKVGELTEFAQKKKILSHINLALLDLHKRFWLRNKRIQLDLDPEIREYNLANKYSKVKQINSFGGTVSFNTTYNKYQDDVLKIERILNKDGIQLPLNDEVLDNRYADLAVAGFERGTNGAVDSFYTPFFNVIRVPATFKDEYVFIEYRATHPRLYLEEDTNPCHLIVDLSPVFLEPILLFVANREFRGMNPDQKQEATDYLQRYEMACKQIGDLGYHIMPNRTNFKLDDNGWV